MREYKALSNGPRGFNENYYYKNDKNEYVFLGKLLGKDNNEQMRFEQENEKIPESVRNKGLVYYKTSTSDSAPQTGGRKSKRNQSQRGKNQRKQSKKNKRTRSRR